MKDKSPTKSAKIESATSYPISIETIRDDPVIPGEHDVVSLLSDSPKQKGIAESSVVHHVAKATIPDVVSLKFDKNTSVHSGYDSIHKECSKLFFPQDRKVVVSMKSGGSEHVSSREALKVNLLLFPFIVNHLDCLVSGSHCLLFFLVISTNPVHRGRFSNVQDFIHDPRSEK